METGIACRIRDDGSVQLPLVLHSPTDIVFGVASSAGTLIKMLDGTIIERRPGPLAGFTTRQYVVNRQAAKDINECHQVLCDIAKASPVTEAGFGLPVFDSERNGWLVDVTLPNAECFDLFDREVIRRANLPDLKSVNVFCMKCNRGHKQGECGESE